MEKRLLLKLFIPVVVAISAAVLIFSFPAMAATFCPGCYGLVRLDEKLLVERGMPTQAQHQLVRDIDKAMIATTNFYGSFSGAPIIIGCSSRECDLRLGGRGAYAVTYSKPFFYGCAREPFGVERNHSYP